MAKQGDTTLVNSRYGFDKVGNITGKTTDQGAFSYRYDSAYQLTQATSPTLPQESFSYDKSGNRLSSSTTTSAWIYNNNNELGGYDDVTFAYDANGNTIRKSAAGQVTNYLYNSRNRLETVQLPDGKTATYTYDPFGRRIRKQVGATTTWFVYSDEGLIGEYETTGSQKRGYCWKPGGLWGTDPAAIVEGEHYYYYHNDHLGTPQKITDASGTVVWSAEYTSFGEATITTGNLFESNPRFPGQYFDKETNTNYNYFRDYDPGTGRYTTFDPIGLFGGINGYAYLRSNPLTFSDPYGLQALLMPPIPRWPLVDDPIFDPANAPIFGPKKCQDSCPPCVPPEGEKFNKVTHHFSHSRDPEKGTHGCQQRTGSPVHWHYSVNRQNKATCQCITQKHAFGGCGPAPP